LGVRSGATVVVAAGSTGGGRIVSVAGSRIALDKSTAAAVLVRVDE
jgi:ferrous iron transport protein A